MASCLQGLGSILGSNITGTDALGYMQHRPTIMYSTMYVDH